MSQQVLPMRGTGFEPFPEPSLQSPKRKQLRLPTLVDAVSIITRAIPYERVEGLRVGLNALLVNQYQLPIHPWRHPA